MWTREDPATLIFTQQLQEWRIKYFKAGYTYPVSWYLETTTLHINWPRNWLNWRVSVPHLELKLWKTYLILSAVPQNLGRWPPSSTFCTNLRHPPFRNLKQRIPFPIQYLYTRVVSYMEISYIQNKRNGDGIKCYETAGVVCSLPATVSTTAMKHQYWVPHE
jgi:hypothetical protein